MIDYTERNHSNFDNNYGIILLANYGFDFDFLYSPI